MSNVVQFLEALSLDTRALTDQDYADAVTTADFDSDTREALLKRDSVALNQILGGSATVLAYIFPAEEEQDGDGKDGDPQPDDDGQEHVQQQSALAA